MELIKKLHINTLHPLWLRNAPDGIAELLPDTLITTRKPTDIPAKQLMLFVYDSIALVKELPLITTHTNHETLLWICYPKQTGTLQSDLIRMNTWDILIQAGYRCQTSVSVNDDWTAMRFTNAPRKKPSKATVPMEERKTDGIDYAARTVKLPDDAEKALNAHKDLASFFYSMAFSHKREYAEAIAEAKKPETRASRIEKMVTMVLAMKQAKEQKALAAKKR